MLEILTIKESEKWDNIVDSFNKHDVYWLSGYVKAFQIHGDGEPLLFYYNDSQTKAINVVMKRDISKDKRFIGKIEENTCFDFSTPYGYGGWIIEGENKQKLFNEYFKWCKENKIVCEFVRYHPVLDNQEYSKEVYEIIPLGNTVCLDISSEDIIWLNLISKNRNMIRKAEKSSIIIKQGFSKELFDRFMEIYNSTMDKDNAEEYYYFKKEFYNSILTDLKDNATIFYAELENKIIASSIMIFAMGI